MSTSDAPLLKYGEHAVSPANASVQCSDAESETGTRESCHNIREFFNGRLTFSPQSFPNKDKHRQSLSIENSSLRTYSQASTRHETVAASVFSSVLNLTNTILGILPSLALFFFVAPSHPPPISKASKPKRLTQNRRWNSWITLCHGAMRDGSRNT